MPSVGAGNDMPCSRWSRTQFCDPGQRRKHHPPRSDQQYLPEDFVLSNDFQMFTLDSPPGQDYRYNDMYGIPNQIGHYNSSPNLDAFARNPYQQHSFLNDLQTYHGASLYSTCRQNFGSDNMRAGAEVMLSETPRTYYKSCSDRTSRTSNRSKYNETIEEGKQLTEVVSGGMKSEHSVSKSKRADSKHNRSGKLCLAGEDLKLMLGKRKSVYPEDHDFQGKRPRYYFEHEGHFVVHKLLRELSSSESPLRMPRTTSASLFYKLLSSEAEPRVMQTVGAPVIASSSRSQKKVIVRDDITEDEVRFLFLHFFLSLIIKMFYF